MQAGEFLELPSPQVLESPRLGNVATEHALTDPSQGFKLEVNQKVAGFAPEKGVEHNIFSIFAPEKRGGTQHFQ